jgi:hypothetical protein
MLLYLVFRNLNFEDKFLFIKVKKKSQGLLLYFYNMIIVEIDKLSNSCKFLKFIQSSFQYDMIVLIFIHFYKTEFG